MPCNPEFAVDQIGRLSVHPYYAARDNRALMALAQALAEQCRGDAHCKLVMDEILRTLGAADPFPTPADLLRTIADVAPEHVRPYGVVGCAACMVSGGRPGLILYWRWDDKFQRDYEYTRRCECNPALEAV